MRSARPAALPAGGTEGPSSGASARTAALVARRQAMERRRDRRGIQRRPTMYDPPWQSGDFGSHRRLAGLPAEVRPRAPTRVRASALSWLFLVESNSHTTLKQSWTESVQIVNRWAKNTCEKQVT